MRTQMLFLVKIAIALCCLLSSNPCKAWLFIYEMEAVEPDRNFGDRDDCLICFASYC